MIDEKYYKVKVKKFIENVTKTFSIKYKSGGTYEKR